MQVSWKKFEEILGATDPSQATTSGRVVESSKRVATSQTCKHTLASHEPIP